MRSPHTATKSSPRSLQLEKAYAQLHDLCSRGSLNLHLTRAPRHLALSPEGGFIAAPPHSSVAGFLTLVSAGSWWRWMGPQRASPGLCLQ